MKMNSLTRLRQQNRILYDCDMSSLLQYISKSSAYISAATYAKIKEQPDDPTPRLMEGGAVRVWFEKSLHSQLKQNGSGKWNYGAHINSVLLVSQQRSQTKGREKYEMNSFPHSLRTIHTCP